MKNNLFLSETIISVVLIVLLVLFLNPFNFLMPPPFLSMLVIGIIVQELNHISDPWLIYSLVGMLIAKMCGMLYGQKKY